MADKDASTPGAEQAVESLMEDLVGLLSPLYHISELEPEPRPIPEPEPSS